MVPPVTVNVAAPVTVLPPTGFVYRAVMVAVPCPTADASPAELMVTIWELLVLQATWFVRLTVVPEDVDPIAMNWPV